ncbi:MAG: CoA transferase [Rhodospirillales bacterium]|nr:CoA transferase [Rhodospirillales bacterium]
MNNPQLLKGIRVLDLSRVMSGPFCTSMLADLGAEVIKIEMPGVGDEGRMFGPFRESESTYFMLLNRNKKSVTVNMKTDEGRALIKALVPKCDVLVENFRPGVMARLGLDEPAMRLLNPSLIYASISGFGQDSPLKDWPAFDLVIQAMSGLMSLTGPKGGPASAVGESVADVCTGMFSAFGICAALFDRERSGLGRHVDIAMLDSMMAMQLTGLSRQLYMNDTPKPVGNRHPVTYPVDSFPTRSGDIVMVCFSDAAFRALGEIMGLPELADDPDYKTNAARNINEDSLRALISRWTSALSQDEAIELLLNARIPAAPVWDLKQLTTSEHVRARGVIVDGHHEKFGTVPLVPQPVKFSQQSADALSAEIPFTPRLGQHTEQVLAEVMELSAEAIAELKKNKAI